VQTSCDTEILLKSRLEKTGKKETPRCPEPRRGNAPQARRKKTAEKKQKARVVKIGVSDMGSFYDDQAEKGPGRRRLKGKTKKLRKMIDYSEAEPGIPRLP